MSEKHVNELERRLADQIYAIDQAAIVAVTDAQGHITYANDKFCQLSKYTLAELLGKTHALINSGYHPKEFFSTMWQTIVSGEVWRQEVCNRAKDGSIYWVDTTIVPFLNEKGSPLKFIAIRYDITHKKETEQELEKDRQRLVESEKMASIGILSSGIAHELGNPLGAIRGRLEMMEMALAQPNFDREALLNSVTKMIYSVDRMSKIIRGLKSFARDGKNDPMLQFDISLLIGDILEISKEKVSKLNLEVRTQGLDTSHVITGRETQIGQVVVNLFNNACDAVKNQKDGWVSVELIEEPKVMTLKFRDSGAGIPPEILNNIFDPFFTTKDVGSGTGLGLSICRSIVASHSGELYIDGADKNTCFVVKLPR